MPPGTVVNRQSRLSAQVRCVERCVRVCVCMCVAPGCVCRSTCSRNRSSKRIQQLTLASITSQLPNKAMHFRQGTYHGPSDAATQWLSLLQTMFHGLLVSCRSKIDSAPHRANPLPFDFLDWGWARVAIDTPAFMSFQPSRVGVVCRVFFRRPCFAIVLLHCCG